MAPEIIKTQQYGKDWIDRYLDRQIYRLQIDRQLVQYLTEILFFNTHIQLYILKQNEMQIDR